MGKDKPLKVTAVYQPAGRKFLERAAKENGFSLDLLPNYQFPREDYHIISDTLPIYCVADGVTLEFENYIQFPEESGAGEAARIFCQTIVKSAENRYKTLKSEDIAAIFEEGNEAVGKYNKDNGRIKDAINFWDFDFFAATGAFVIVKDGLVHWASICDSFVVRADKNGKIIFKSPECWPESRRHSSEGFTKYEWKKEIRKKYRNSVSADGLLNGYGVVTGEEAACRYLNLGNFQPESGETVLLITDGFEEYLNEPEFMKIISECSSSEMESAVKKFSLEKADIDPRRFGHERTLIVLNF